MNVAGNGQFSVAIDQFIGKVAAKNEQNCRKTYIELSTDIIMGTPVDTGVTVNNWLPSTGSPKGGTREIKDESRLAVLSEVRSTAASWNPKNGDAFLTNNSIVAVVLEYGLYPNPPKLGTYLRKGQMKRGRVGPGYFKFSINGYSEMSPRGMVGLSIAKKKGGA